MSKERLEEIGKNATGILNMDSGEVDSVDLSIIDFTWLFKFAKEQAKRVEELEMKHENIGAIFSRQSMRDRIQVLERQNKRYREALKFYTNKENWRKLIIEGDTMRLGKMRVEEDCGKKASQALEGEPHES